MIISRRKFVGSLTLTAATLVASPQLAVKNSEDPIIELPDAYIDVDVKKLIQHMPNHKITHLGAPHAKLGTMTVTPVTVLLPLKIHRDMRQVTYSVLARFIGQSLQLRSNHVGYYLHAVCLTPFLGLEARQIFMRITADSQIGIRACKLTLLTRSSTDVKL